MPKIQKHHYAASLILLMLIAGAVLIFDSPSTSAQAVPPPSVVSSDYRYDNPYGTANTFSATTTTSATFPVTVTGPVADQLLLVSAYGRRINVEGCTVQSITYNGTPLFAAVATTTKNTSSLNTCVDTRYLDGASFPAAGTYDVVITWTTSGILGSAASAVLLSGAADAPSASDEGTPCWPSGCEIKDVTVSVSTANSLVLGSFVTGILNTTPEVGANQTPIHNQTNLGTNSTLRFGVSTEVSTIPGNITMSWSDDPLNYTYNRTAHVAVVVPPAFACENGGDDDGDSLIDAADPGCGASSDNDESHTPPTTFTNGQRIVVGVASTNLYPIAAGALAPTSNMTSSGTQSQDAKGVINVATPTYGFTGAPSYGGGVWYWRVNFDAGTDGWVNAANLSAAVECNNGQEDDSPADGFIDFSGGDPGCTSSTDTDEYNAPPSSPPSVVSSDYRYDNPYGTANTFTATTSSSATFPFTVPSASVDQLLIISTYAERNNAVGCAVNSVTYGASTPQRAVATTTKQSGWNSCVSTWYVTDPPAGTSNVVITWNGSVPGKSASAVLLSGAADAPSASDEGTPCWPTACEIKDVTVSVSTANSLVVDAFMTGQITNVATADPSQTEIHRTTNGGTYYLQFGVSTKAAGSIGNTSMHWNHLGTYNRTVHIAVAVPPSGAAPAQCANSGDDDTDGYIDAADPGCGGSSDNNESDEIPPTTFSNGQRIVVGVASASVYPISAGALSPTSGMTPSGSQVLNAGGAVTLSTPTYGFIGAPSYEGGAWYWRVNFDSGTDGWAADGNLILPAQCNDGQDNDTDTYIDLNDVGCSSTSDNDESDVESNPDASAACNDTVDNDGDGYKDRYDPGCAYADDDSELNRVSTTHTAGSRIMSDPDDPISNSTTVYKRGCFIHPGTGKGVCYHNGSVPNGCNDGIDNDGDSAIDFSSDTGCSSAADTTEVNTVAGLDACEDNIDNDGDGIIDYSADMGCTGPGDNHEHFLGVPKNVIGTALNSDPIYADNSNTGQYGKGAWFWEVDWDPAPGSPPAEYPGISYRGTDGYTCETCSRVAVQCEDKIDNDGDGQTDFGSDTGCVSLSDRSEDSALREITGWAWSETVGWISFADPNPSNDYGLNVDPTGLISGYAWNENIGWISFNKSQLGQCPAGLCEARVATSTGKVTGWARACLGTATASNEIPGTCATAADHPGGWDGWISLSKQANESIQYGVTISDCNYSGWAWGGDILGWISFSGATYSTLQYQVTGAEDGCASLVTFEIACDWKDDPENGEYVLDFLLATGETDSSTNGVRKADSDRRLNSRHGGAIILEATTTAATFPTPVPSGYYDIWLQIYDAHGGSGEGWYQKDESAYIELYNAASTTPGFSFEATPQGNRIGGSSPTTDIPDYVPNNIITTDRVNTNFFLPVDAVSARLSHKLFSELDQSGDVFPTDGTDPGNKPGAPPAAYACNDGVDNDVDTYKDYGEGSSNDPGCSSVTDNNEYNAFENTFWGMCVLLRKVGPAFELEVTSNETTFAVVKPVDESGTGNWKTNTIEVTATRLGGFTGDIKLKVDSVYVKCVDDEVTCSDAEFSTLQSSEYEARFSSGSTEGLIFDTDLNDTVTITILDASVLPGRYGVKLVGWDGACGADYVGCSKQNTIDIEFAIRPDKLYTPR